MPTLSSARGQKREHGQDERRERLRGIAEATLDAIEQGSYVLNGINHDLSAGIALSKRKTGYYSPDSLLSGWASMTPSGNTKAASSQPDVTVLEVSTLEGARLLSTTQPPTTTPSRRKIGVLNFASATKPGGGFKNGAQAQEESLARSSTLYSTLTTSLSQTFYTLHDRDPKGGYYTHAMIYSPGVVVFRDDHGGWAEPMAIDVLTSAAVNAGAVRQSLSGQFHGSAVEDRIEKVMRERMARVLFLFEKQGVKDLVLGSFGTGVFRNNVTLVANIWADLLVVDGARFGASFERVVFAILGRSTFESFEEVLRRRRNHSAPTPGL